MNDERESPTVIIPKFEVNSRPEPTTKSSTNGWEIFFLFMASLLMAVLIINILVFDIIVFDTLLNIDKIGWR